MPHYCIDCRHFRRRDHAPIERAICDRPAIRECDGDMAVAPGISATAPLGAFCGIERSKWQLDDHCGPEAKYFEPKPARPWWKLF